jgi:hypothetical protein
MELSVGHAGLTKASYDSLPVVTKQQPGSKHGWAVLQARLEGVQQTNTTGLSAKNEAHSWSQ